MNILSLEFRKTKRRGIWLVVAALLAVQFLWLFYVMNKEKNIPQGWMMQLYNMPVLNGITVPTFIAVLASRLIDLEHKGNTWKLLETVQSKYDIYFGKVLYGFFCVLIFATLQLAAIIALGYYLNYEGQPDLWAYALYCLETLAITFLLYLLQMLVSTLFPNQAAALCIGLCGSMAGLFLMYMPQWPLLREIIPWGHYGAAMFVGMAWDRATRDATFYYMALDKHFPFFFGAWLIGLSVGGWMLFQRMDTDGAALPVFGKAARRKAVSHEAALTEQLDNNADISVKIPRIPLTPIEGIKIKRTPIWLAFLILPAISALIGTFNYLNNLELLQNEWHSLWTQHSLFFCYFFMPPLIGVYASYLWRLEHNGTNWNMIMAYVSPWKIVRNKALACIVMATVTLFWETALYVFCGYCCKLTQPVPAELLEWLLCGIVGGAAVCMAQCLFSLVIRSFAIPIGIALVGGIAGLVATGKGLWRFIPYALLSVGMRANNPNRELEPFVFLVSCGAFILLFYLLSVWYLKKTDVRTQE